MRIALSLVVVLLFLEKVVAGWTDYKPLGPVNILCFIVVGGALVVAGVSRVARASDRVVSRG